MKNIILICTLIFTIVGFSYAGSIDQNNSQKIINSDKTFSSKEIHKYFNIHKKDEILSFRKWFKSNKTILSKSDLILSGSITQLGDRIKTSNRSPFSSLLLHSYQYANISFIFGRNNQLGTGKNNIRSKLQMIDYPGIKIIKADASHSKGYSTDLVKIYEYSGSTLSGAINYMSRIVSLSKNCVPNIERPQEIRGNRGPNYFSFGPSEEWSEEWRAKTVEEYYSNSYSEKLNKALKKLKCDTTGEYYKYLRYPQLHKIFGILSHAKYIRGDPGQFEFIGIRNSSGSIEVSPNI